MEHLLGINRENKHFIAYNPNDTLKETGNLDSDYKVPGKTFAVGTNNAGGNELATAKFKMLHIGGGYNGNIDTVNYNAAGAGLTITEDGQIYTNATLPGQLESSGRLAPQPMRTAGSVVLSAGEHYTSDNVGKITVSTNEYRNIGSQSQNAINNITYDESLPVVALSDRPSDKRVFGVITGKTGDRISVQASGEGTMKVCDLNGDLHYGDYITSSSIKGVGMKQTEDYVTNATVAKVIRATSFEDAEYVQENGTQITEDQYKLLKGDSRQVGKMQTIECVFVCGA